MEQIPLDNVTPLEVDDLFEHLLQWHREELLCLRSRLPLLEVPDAIEPMRLYLMDEDGDGWEYL